LAIVDVPGRLTRWVIAPVLIGMAIAVGVIGLHGARDATVIGYQTVVQHSQDPVEMARTTRYRSVVEQVREKVPEGATVFVPQTSDLSDTVTVEWEQRLPEIALMQGHDVLADAESAAYWLRVVQNGPNATLVVERKH
jgi:hypothetical protein